MRLLRNPRLDMPLLSSRRPIRPRRQQRFNMLRLHNLQFDMPLLPSRSLTGPLRRLRKNRVVKSLRPQKPSLLQPIKGREFLGIGTALRIWCTIGITFKSNGRHGDDRAFGKPLFQIVLFRFDFSQAEPPAVIMDHDADMIRVVQARRRFPSEYNCPSSANRTAFSSARMRALGATRPH